jgi:hypothetical protein
MAFFDFRTIGLARCQTSRGLGPMDSAPTPNIFRLAVLLRPAPEQKGKGKQAAQNTETEASGLEIPTAPQQNTEQQAPLEFVPFSIPPRAAARRDMQGSARATWTVARRGGCQRPPPLHTHTRIPTHACQHAPRAAQGGSSNAGCGERREEGTSQTPTVGLEPTTTRLRALRSTD